MRKRGVAEDAEKSGLCCPGGTRAFSPAIHEIMQMLARNRPNGAVLCQPRAERSSDLSDGAPPWVGVENNTKPQRGGPKMLLLRKATPSGFYATDGGYPGFRFATPWANLGLPRWGEE